MYFVREKKILQAVYIMAKSKYQIYRKPGKAMDIFLAEIQGIRGKTNFRYIPVGQPDQIYYR